MLESLERRERRLLLCVESIFYFKRYGRHSENIVLYGPPWRSLDAAGARAALEWWRPLNSVFASDASLEQTGRAW